MNAIRLYGRMALVSIKSQVQYRASFLMMAAGNALSAFIEYLGIWAMFGRFETLRGWMLAEAAVFFGMGNVAFALCEFFMHEFDTFERHVKSGDFDRILLRPRSTVLMMLGAQVRPLRIGRLLQGAVILGIGLSRLDVLSWWGAAHWLLLAFAIIGGTFLFSGVIILQATTCFWTVESLEAWNCLTYGGIQLAQYPLNIYERPLRFFFSYVFPLAAMSYWPCSALLGRGYASSALAWLSPGLGCAFFALSLIVWHVGVRHYRSTGS